MSSGFSRHAKILNQVSGKTWDVSLVTGREEEGARKWENYALPPLRTG